MTRLPHFIQRAAWIAAFAALLVPAGAGASVQGPGEISDDTLAAVASAFIQVVGIHERYLSLIAVAPTAEEAARLQQEAADRMVEAIQSEDGLTLEQYNGVMQAVQVDEVLRARLMAHIENAVHLMPPLQRA